MKANDLAAADHGFKLGVGGGADQDQDRARAGFFECFEKRVGRFVGEIVGIFDHGDSELAGHGFEGEFAAKFADGVNRQSLLVFRATDSEEVRVRFSDDLFAPGASAAGRKFLWEVFFAQEALGKGAGDCGFSD